jgi:hypothetical protein
MLILSYFGLAVTLLAAGLLAGFGFRLLFADKVEGRKSAARVRSLRDALMGRARTRDDWMPDGRIKGGMIYNRRKKRLEVSGRLSNDTLDRVFRAH